MTQYKVILTYTVYVIADNKDQARAKAVTIEPVVYDHIQIEEVKT